MVGPGACSSGIRYECSGQLKVSRGWLNSLGLRVGYTGTIVNQHGLELYLVDARVRISQTWARIPWEIPDVLDALEFRG